MCFSLFHLLSLTREDDRRLTNLKASKHKRFSLSINYKKGAYYMNKLEFMRRAVIVLIVWNVVLTVGFLLSVNVNLQEKLNQEICYLEEIPMEDLR